MNAVSVESRSMALGLVTDPARLHEFAANARRSWVALRK